MKPFAPLSLLLVALFIAAGCSEPKVEKGFPVSDPVDEEGKPIDGFAHDSLKMATRPGPVLLTTHPRHRLMAIMKVNINRKKNTRWTGNILNHFNSYPQTRHGKNRWHGNFLPGLETSYGFNFVNVAHFDTATKSANNLFQNHVLIRTLYYPAYTNDTLNGKPVLRDYYLVSVYNQDTNKDGYINLSDLRRFYRFDLQGENRAPLLPENYSVLSCQYDSDNDYLYLKAQLDENSNGQRDVGEPRHVFWVNLANPAENGRLY